MGDSGEECSVSRMLRLVQIGQVDKLRAIIGGVGDVAELCTASGEDGWSVFTLAVDLGRSELVRQMCEARVPVNQPNKVRLAYVSSRSVFYEAHGLVTAVSGLVQKHYDIVY